MDENQVFVTTDLNDDRLWRDSLSLTDVHWINGEPDLHKKYQVRTRYRAPLVACSLKKVDGGLEIILEEQVRAITPGQSAVLYDGDLVLGGGIAI